MDVVSSQEVTVKGLEPDIQKLIAKHKSEFKRLKSLHQVNTVSRSLSPSQPLPVFVFIQGRD